MIPVTVREAPQGSTWGAEVLQLPGVEVLRASLERRLPDPPVTKLTGLRLSEVGLATASAWMPASAWWQTAAGVFLAGTTAFVADMALGSSVLASAPAAVGMTTSELSVSFLRPATMRSQTITGRGRLIHATRSLGPAPARSARVRPARPVPARGRGRCLRQGVLGRDGRADRDAAARGRRDPSSLLPAPGNPSGAGLRRVDDHGHGGLGVAVRRVRGPCTPARSRTSPTRQSH